MQKELEKFKLNTKQLVKNEEKFFMPRTRKVRKNFAKKNPAESFFRGANVTKPDSIM